jgi:hypothetical protein
MADSDAAPQRPKVFISYSWSSEAHKQLVRSLADRLMEDGVEVILDIYDLKEGNDKHAFMEKFVTDPTVTHALIICDKVYSEKANARKAGVGTETQLISKEVYDKVDQSKFIPIACEFDDQGEAYLPAFLSSRIWIDFSTREKINQNWERLIRLLYGKPEYVKPSLGQAPIYLAEVTSVSSNPIRIKFERFKQAILEQHAGINRFRADFIDACFQHIEDLRFRPRPEASGWGKKIIEDCSKLGVVRDYIVDWILVEGEVSPNDKFIEALLDTFENLKELKRRSDGKNFWEEVWADVHKLFVFELFLYAVAALVRVRAFAALGFIFSHSFLRPQHDRYGEKMFDSFLGFYAYSDKLQELLAPPGQRLYSPAAELIKIHAQRSDITFDDLIEADLLALFVSLTRDSNPWFPQLMYYADRSHQFPVFVRAIRAKDFKALALISGIDDAERLRAAVTANISRLNGSSWSSFWGRDFAHDMNLTLLNSVK